MQVKSEIIMRVWRVCDIHDNGPYQDDEEELRELLSKHSIHNNRPAPMFDEFIRRAPREDEVCCFLNLKQAYAWFTQEELKILEKFGYKLRRIVVNEITVYGHYQILAIKVKRVFRMKAISRRIRIFNNNELPLVSDKAVFIERWDIKKKGALQCQQDVR